MPEDYNRLGQFVEAISYYNAKEFLNNRRRVNHENVISLVREKDPVTLEEIKAIPGMQGIVTAVYDVPVGQAWPLENILELKKW